MSVTRIRPEQIFFLAPTPGNLSLLECGNWCNVKYKVGEENRMAVAQWKVDKFYFPACRLSLKQPAMEDVVGFMRPADWRE